MTTPWEEYKKKLGATRPWDVVLPSTKYVTAEESTRRFSICQGCDKFVKITGQCSECLCFMKLKTSMEDATCPLHKW